jgi:hypothetical protein
MVGDLGVLAEALPGRGDDPRSGLVLGRDGHRDSEAGVRLCPPDSRCCRAPLTLVHTSFIELPGDHMYLVDQSAA